MYRFESLIDRTEFGLIAGYLRSPQSPIRTLLHVRSEQDLARVAEVLSAEHPRPFSLMGGVPDSLKPMLESGDLKVTHRDGFPNSPQRAVVDIEQVPGATECKVIYAAPFYLVHTPGLFERQERQETQQRDQQKEQEREREKEQTRRQEEGRSERARLLREQQERSQRREQKHER